MFQNSFQNGNYFELFDPKISQDKMKNLFKMINVSPNHKVFDKDLKTYVYQFNSSTSKIIFPKQDKKQLYLIQQYLIFQIFIYPGMSWSMQLVISDLNKSKRRIILSPVTNKLEIKPFFVKSPGVNFKEGMWNNFIVDLYSFMQAFKGQTYRCLDNIMIQGSFKLRRIYTTNSITNLLDNNENQQTQSLKSINFFVYIKLNRLPKNFFFPPDIQQISLLTKYTGQTLNNQINLYQPTQPSTKNNSSYLKSSKNRLSTPKTQTVKSEKIVQVSKSIVSTNTNNKLNQKQFLANTNGPQMLNRLRKRQIYHESSDSQSHITDNNVNTPSSTQKGEIKSKKKLIKTQVMPPKATRTSVQKRQKSKNIAQNKIQQKQKIKSKLNPWRTNTINNKKSQTSKFKQKIQSDLQSSPNTTLFKSNNKFNQSSTVNKGFDRKSDHYSQSQYIELSQKFSTVTDGKFFKNNQSINNNDNSRMKDVSGLQNNREFENQDQIQQNIQMQTNSMYSNSNKKGEQQYVQKEQIINESICDSLDRRSPKKDFEVIGRQSYYGFAQRLMQNYMQQKTRPFSPPMHQRQHTQQQQYGIQLNRNNSLNEQKQVQLVYDPVLNCYYDHKTHTYYQLKN